MFYRIRFLMKTDNSIDNFFYRFKDLIFLAILTNMLEMYESL